MDIIFKKDSDSAGVIDRMHSSYFCMTKREQMVADYVLNQTGVTHKSITEVVKECGVGYGSVMRFCKKLGCKGFQDFKISLSEALAKEGLQAGLLQGFATEDWASQLLERLVADMRQTMVRLDMHVLRMAAKRMLCSKRVLISGYGASRIPATEIEYRLLRLGLPAFFEASYHEVQYRAAGMGEGDSGILVSYSGSSKEMIETSKLLKKNGASVICFTNYADSPLAETVDFVIPTFIKADPRAEELPRRPAQDIAIEAFFHMIIELDQNLHKKLRRTYESVADRQL